MSTHWYRWDGEDLILDVRTVPRASRDEIAGPLGGQLKVRITAPPVDGRANACLLRFLARSCGVPARQAKLLSGSSSRSKRIRILSPVKLPPGVEPAAS